jgi:hypothetical protein
MTRPTERESIPTGATVPAWTVPRAPAQDIRRTRDRHSPVVFCASGGAGGFGGIYWLDDRAERGPREGGQP